MRSFLVVPTAFLLLALPSVALADDEPTPRPEASNAVVKPAQVLTDPKTGVQQVVVPPGCSSTIQSTGQIVVLCPGPESAPAKAAAQPVAEAPSTRKWYGWQTLMVDGINHGVSAFILVGAVATDSPSTAAFGGLLYLTGYTLGGPIVHWGNGQVGKGFASLGIRVGAPIVLGLTGAALGSGDDETAVSLAAVGIVAGMATAIAVDSAALAYKTVEPSRSAKKAPKLQWAPNGGYDSKRQSFTVGVGGTF